ncbi:uncharacterized protein [Branchiostoma lanceolatum]|uniref:uncharacterized protein n=1 Tax=Branchiostoma lanceolatum TaxID=7740 RepID=UPI0034514BC5
MSNNGLKSFPIAALSKIPSISRLYIQNNHMQILPLTAYDKLASISTVDTDNNPWQCDCRMVPFREKMNGSHSFEDQITCEDPSNFLGQKLKDINLEDLICEEPRIVRFERLDDNTVVEGETLHLVCEASGIPTPDITVILPSGLNATDESGGRVIVGVNGTVTIPHVTTADSGLYTCFVESFVGSTNDTLSVTVAPALSVSAIIIGSVVATLFVICVLIGIKIFWKRPQARSDPNSDLVDQYSTGLSDETNLDLEATSSHTRDQLLHTPGTNTGHSNQFNRTDSLPTDDQTKLISCSLSNETRPKATSDDSHTPGPNTGHSNPFNTTDSQPTSTDDGQTQVNSCGLSNETSPKATFDDHTPGSNIQGHSNTTDSPPTDDGTETTFEPSNETVLESTGDDNHTSRDSSGFSYHSFIQPVSEPSSKDIYTSDASTGPFNSNSTVLVPMTNAGSEKKIAKVSPFNYPTTGNGGNGDDEQESHDNEERDGSRETDA